MSFLEEVDALRPLEGLEGGTLLPYLVKGVSWVVWVRKPFVVWDVRVH